MNVLFRVLEDVVVMVHGVEPPTTEEWDAWLDGYMEGGAPRRLPIYVVTEGGGPDVNQRDTLNRRFAKVRPRAAVITTSGLVRGIITALQWVGHIDLKGFVPDKRRDALVFLGLRATRMKVIDATVRELQHEIQTTLTASRTA